MAEPLRITFVTGDFYPDQVGGQGIYAFEIATRVARAGYAVTVVAPQTPGRSAYPYPPGLSTRFLGRGAPNPLLFTARAARWRRDIAQGADVVHVNELFGFVLAIPRQWRPYGLVTSSHNSYLDRFHAAQGIRKLRYPALIALESLTYPRADR